jgi:trehalose 6-phosphate phosphatase
MTEPAPALPEPIEAFIEAHVRHEVCILALDYDGTLAPFRIDRDKAVPSTHTRVLLQRLSAARGTRLVIVSGRPAADIAQLLDIKPTPEVWGVHGWEHLPPGGTLTVIRPSAEAMATIDREEVRLAGLTAAARIERKSASLAVHWRGLVPQAAALLESQVREEWDAIAPASRLEVRAFDGGIELRAAARDKGTVVHSLLEPRSGETPLLYMGDDETDEDAFREARAWPRALGVRVGEPTHDTAAGVTVGQESVTTFLETWLAATEARDAAESLTPH